MADMLRAKNAGNFVDIFEGQDKQGHFIRGGIVVPFFSKTHQQKYIAYFFDADSKNHVYFVQK